MASMEAAYYRAYYLRNKDRILERLRVRRKTDPEFRARQCEKEKVQREKPGRRAARTARDRVRRAERRQALARYPMPDTCEICHQPRGTDILRWDHDHKTNLHRGWLCSNCNAGLGMFKDLPALLERARDYLKERQP
jgi:Recombination endonuclease VII